MALARARAVQSLHSSLRHSGRRALPRASAFGRNQLVQRRWASGGESHGEASSDIPWMAGAVAVTVPSCWYLWPDTSHAEHHGGEHDEHAADDEEGGPDATEVKGGDESKSEDDSSQVDQIQEGQQEQEDSEHGDSENKAQVEESKRQEEENQEQGRTVNDDQDSSEGGGDDGQGEEGKSKNMGNVGAPKGRSTKSESEHRQEGYQRKEVALGEAQRQEEARRADRAQKSTPQEDQAYEGKKEDQGDSKQGKVQTHNEDGSRKGNVKEQQPGKEATKAAGNQKSALPPGGSDAQKPDEPAPPPKRPGGEASGAVGAGKGNLAAAEDEGKQEKKEEGHQISGDQPSEDPNEKSEAE